MAATTTLLGLVTPTQGTLTGTWGDTVNYGISDYVDISVAGTLTLTNDGAVTLANTTGSSAGSNITSTLTGAGTVTAQFAIVRVTGTLTVAKVVTGPSYSKTYTVVNAATGGIVTFKASGQTGVSVAVGESAFVYFNGTDYVKVSGTVAVASFQTSLGGLTPSTATTGVVTLAGTLNTTSGGTGLTSFTAGDVPYYASGSVLSKLAIGTAGQFLTSTGTAPQWSTLSGVAVTTFSAGTTGFTPSSATSGAVTLAGTLATTNGGTGLTSFTSGGVVYASSSSALATGSALTFDGNGALKATGSTDGFISNTFVNTSAGTSAVNRIQIGNNTSDGSGQIVIYGGNHSTLANVMDVNNANNAALRFLTNNTERARVDSSGNLLVGTTSAISKLTVQGASDVRVTVNESGSSVRTDLISQTTQGLVGTQSSHPFDVMTGGTTRARFDTAGNLGLGVTPSAWFSGVKALQFGTAGAVWSSNDRANLTANLYLDAATAFRYINNGYALRYAQELGTHAWSIAASGTAGDAISFTQAMTLDASGDLMVGATSNPSAARLLLESASTAGTLLNIKNTSTGGYSWNIASVGSAAVLAPVGSLAFRDSTNGATRMILDSAGNMALGGITPSAFGYAGNIQIPGGGRYFSSSGDDIRFGANVYNDGSLEKYAATGNAEKYRMSDGTHQWYYAASGSANATISFTEAMRITSAGNVGIGTSSPATKLDVNGGITVNGSVLFNANGDSSSATGEIKQLTGSGLTIYSKTGSSYDFTLLNAGGSNLIRNPTGTANVEFPQTGAWFTGTGLGIGTSSPTSLLHIEAAATATIQLDSTNSNRGNFYIQSKQSGSANWFQIGEDTGGDFFTIMSDNNGSGGGAGNVGIGTSSPATKLDVSGTGPVILRLNDTVTNYWQLESNSYLAFNRGGTEAARITNTGDLLVGATATASYFDGKLNVFNAGVSASFKNSVDTLPSIIAWNATTTGDAVFVAFATEVTVSQRGSITYNRAGGLTVYNTTSDYRAKDISGPVTNSGALIDSIPVYMGKMKDATQERPMFIAHETPPYAHTGEKDAIDADGNPVYQQMDASALIPVMWAEIQSLRKRLADAGI